jgi:mannosyltransferase
MNLENTKVRFGAKANQSVRWVVCVLALVSFTLGVWRNDAKSMWWDESLSLKRAQSGFVTILTNKLDSSAGISTSQHPPFYFVLLRSLTLLIGESDTALRFPSALFTSLLVPLIFVFGCRLRSRRTGVLAAILTTFSPFLLWYSQEARMYTLVTFLGLLSTYLLWRAIETRAWYLGMAFSLVTCLGLVTQYLFVLLIPAQILFAIIISPLYEPSAEPRRWQRLVSRVALVIPFAVLAILATVIIQLIPGLSSNRTFVPLWMIARDILNSFSLGLSVNYFKIWPIDLVFLTLFIFGIYSIGIVSLSFNLNLKKIRIFKKSVIVYLLAYIFIPILSIWVFSYFTPLYMGSRYLIMSLPAFILTIALALDTLAGWRPMIAWIVLISLVGSMGYSIVRYYTADEYANKEDYRAAAQNIASHESSGDIIFVKWAEVVPAFRHYYEGRLQILSLRDLELQIKADPNALTYYSQNYDRIWLVEGNEQNISSIQQLQGKIFNNQLLLSENVYAGYVYPVTLSSYMLRSPGIYPDTYTSSPLGVFGQQIQLIDYSLRYFNDHRESFKVSAEEIRSNAGMTNSVPAGNTIGIYLTVHALQALVDCKTSLRLVDEQGRIVVQHDDIPLMYLPSSQWPLDLNIQFQTYMRIPLGTPPGLYRLALLFYRQSDGQALTYQDTSTSPEMPWYEIRSVRVSEGQPYSYELNTLPDGQIPLSLPPRFGGMQLQNYTLPQAAQAGSSIVTFFYWRVIRFVEPDLEIVINWRDSAGRIWLSSHLDPSSIGDNPSSWPLWALRKCVYTLEVPDDAPRGESDLFLLVRLRSTNRYYGLWRGILPMFRHAFHLGSVQIN